MKDTVIFCWSGTGNCLDMAKNIAKALGGADIISVRKKPEVTDVRSAKRVGFVFPCHGGGAPVDFLENVRGLQIDKGSYVFAVSQSASYPGTGLAELNKIHPLSYWKAVTHQCTCIWLFPHFMQVPPIGAKAAQKRSEHLSKKIAKDIQAQKLSKKDPGAFFLNAAENKAWPTVLKLKAKKFKVSEKCIGCGQCAKICPRENIEIKNGKAFIGRNCVGCLGCLQYCPTKAISLGKVTDRREHYTNPNVTVAELTSGQLHI